MMTCARTSDRLPTASLIAAVAFVFGMFGERPSSGIGSMRGSAILLVLLAMLTAALAVAGLSVVSLKFDKKRRPAGEVDGSLRRRWSVWMKDAPTVALGAAAVTGGFGALTVDSRGIGSSKSMGGLLASMGVVAGIALVVACLEKILGTPE